jgi:hypothetical protein
VGQESAVPGLLEFTAKRLQAPSPEKRQKAPTRSDETMHVERKWIPMTNP